MICMQAVLWKYLIQREHVYENVLTDMLTTSNNVGKKIYHKNYFMPFILIVINIVNKNGKLRMVHLQALEVDQFLT